MVACLGDMWWSRTDLLAVAQFSHACVTWFGVPALPQLLQLRQEEYRQLLAGL